MRKAEAKTLEYPGELQVKGRHPRCQNQKQ